ncbi:OPT oligopeptide transporter protein-domain-containing protein [Suillus subalutaceus]|uniref:OPT oligopeptide transporter protein-domain-containing protein n=1 Tax=Suillus subalutaceus TaxID=48586 RepID=UPI001B883BB1|nr:OPT oligopeptide transporter protein-domain-containing protein [Suillus subalutaceus]KAG1829215.1 OPT oligopeptide transporter protein-domain-containing protein [Suillus subalutaceus]
MAVSNNWISNYENSRLRLTFETATVDADSDSEEGVLSNERDIATHVISVDDDPSLNPWTFRAFFIGLGLSTFGGVLVSLMFLAVVSYILGIFMETFIPRRGLLRYLNPGPFNKKENAFVVIMASASANSALGTEVLAVQRLYYNITPNAGASVFLLFSSQLLGYGIGGMMRGILLYPSKMLYPGVLPLLSMFDALYEGGNDSTEKAQSLLHCVYCLPTMPAVSRVFGGTNGNEGLGLLSICFDWQYISGGVNPMTIPLKAQFSNLLGYLLCMVVFVAVYYNNIWKAQNFPFLSQLLFYENGTQYNQTLILNANYAIIFSSGTGTDMRSAWSWMTPSGIKKLWANFDWKFWQSDGMRKQDVDDEDIDPHYKQMLKYPDAPNSWYFVVFLLSFVVALVVLYKTDSTLPWLMSVEGGAFLISLLLATISILFFCALAAITGLMFAIQPFVQMIGGYLHKGLPVANMYFVLYGSNSVTQANLLLRDLKIAQSATLALHLPAQILGTLLGAILNFIMMNSIIDNQREILLSVQGTNIWSGQQPQMYNSQAIAWGGLSHELFSVGHNIPMVGLFIPVPFWVIHRYWPKLSMLTYLTDTTSDGFVLESIHLSSPTFAIAFLSQWWLRTRYPRWFAKYNYIIGAALDGGTQVMVFILSFAVQGAAGTSHLFAPWWGANQGGNYDRCLYLN